MNDKEKYKKLIELVIENSYETEFELLQWLFKKYDEAEKSEVENG